MKSKLLLLAGVLTFFISCGLEDAGKSDCFIDVEDTLDSWQGTYNYQMANAKDNDGNTQSLEAYLIRKRVTEEYIQSLKSKQSLINSNRCCTRNEENTHNSRINKRFHQSEEDMENIW